MKIKLRYFLVLFLSFTISTSQADSLLGHIPFFHTPSKKTVVTGLVIGGISLYIYSQLSKYIENAIKKNDEGKLSKSETANMISKEMDKILSNPKKTDQQKSQSVAEAQQLLLYYAIAYYDTSDNDIYEIAVKAAKKSNIYTGYFESELQQGIRMTSEIMRNMISLANAKDMEDTRRRQNNCDINDIAARTYIYNPSNPSFANLNRPVFEFDTGSYNDLNIVARKYLKPGIRDKIKDNFDHDHIPAKSALKIYLANRDKFLYKFNTTINKIIDNNGSVVAINQAMHNAGRTYQNRAKSTMQRDSKDLRKATLKDFKMHYYYYKKNGSTNKSFETLFVKAFLETYNRNKMMCLYIKN